MKLPIAILTAAISIIIVGVVLVPSLPHEPDHPLDVIIIAGQSNAEYSNSPMVSAEVLNEDYAEVPAHTLLYYGTDSAPTNMWRGGTKSLHNMYDSSAQQYLIGGYEPILANELSKKTSNDVLVINTGIGSRTVAQLNPANDSTYGQYVKTVVADAMELAKSNYESVRPIGYIWLQGEADYSTPMNEYIKQFDQVNDFYHSYGFNHCYVVHTRNYYGGAANFAMTQILQTHDDVTLATSITDSFTVGSNTLDDSNPIHYSQHGRDLIALELQDVIDAPESPRYFSLFEIVPLLVIVAILCMIIGVAVRTRV